MSKAFTKEDDEIPERSGRMRSPSGLPPGAVDYLTAEGERRLRSELEKLQISEGGRRAERIRELQRVLASVTVVPERETTMEEVLFGATVTVRDAQGELARYRIVGVEETGLAPGWVSWVSPLAKALIGARVGDRVRLGEGAADEVVIVAVE